MKKADSLYSILVGAPEYQIVSLRTILGHFVVFLKHLSSWVHPAVLPVKKNGRRGCQKHIKLPAARSQGGGRRPEVGSQLLMPVNVTVQWA